jgi:CheY-like chemotaxis protein
VTLALSTGASVPLHPSSHEGLAGLAALVVDDNDTNLRILSEILASRGMTVVSASDAGAAQAAVDGSPHVFSLAVIDMHLGDTSGIELAAALRGHRCCASAAVLMLTSADHQRDARDVAAMGSARYAVKPVGHVALLDNVAKALGARTMPDILPAAPEVTPARAARHLYVLVAEDNIVNCKVVDNLLRRRGHEPIIVPNGRAAVDAVARERYDLILMDLQMPETCGSTRS